MLIDNGSGRGLLRWVIALLLLLLWVVPLLLLIRHVGGRYTVRHGAVIFFLAVGVLCRVCVCVVSEA